MAGHGGGAWKVAYADFVTAMMAFFMVMWIIAQGKPPVKQAIAQYFKDPSQFSSKPTGPTSLLPPGKQTEASSERPKTGLLRGPKRGKGIAVPEKGHDPGAVADRPSVHVLRNGSRRVVGTLVLFEGDSAELDEAGQQVLERLAPNFKGKPNRIEIRGRASRRATGDDEAETWRLCYARCLAVKQYLESHGIEPERIRLSQAGPHEPVAAGNEPEKVAQNSSVELYLLDEFVEGYASGNAAAQP